MFAKRTDWVFSTNALMARLEDLQKQKKNIIDLTESNPTRCAFSYPRKDLILALTAEDNISYKPMSKGLLLAREAAAKYYQNKNIPVGAENIFLTSGTSEAYSFLFRLLLNPGERILIARPSYPLFEFLAQLNDVGMDYYSLIYNEGWSIDLESLTNALTPQTRAIVIVNPNNPTGIFLKKEELNAINAIAKQHGLAVICDEVFLDYRLEETALPVSLAGNREVLTFTLSGISKILGLPQMKISWIAASGPDKMVEESLKRLEIIADTYLSVGTPAQNALASWMSFQPLLHKEIESRCRANKAFLVNSVSEIPGVSCLKSEGGWYAVIGLPGNLSEEEWVMAFLEKDSVFVHPGYFFDFEDEPFAVVSLLLPGDIFKEGVRRMAARIQTVLS